MIPNYQLYRGLNHNNIKYTYLLLYIDSELIIQVYIILYI